MSNTEDPMTVLVVDDREDMGELTSVQLEQQGFKTIYEDDPKKAIEKHNLTEATTDVDCIISDYEMPELNGLQFLDEVRTTNPRVPFILYTARGSEEIASEAISMGVTDYVQKDSGKDHYAVLSNRIKQSIQKYRAETAQLKSVEKNTLREIQGIFTKKESIREKQQSLLEFGCSYLGMPAGFISKISDTHMTLVNTYNIDEEKLDGNRHCPLEKTYCQHTIEMDKPLMISDAHEEGLADTKEYKHWGIESYIGSRILVDGELYGTLCFIDLDNTSNFNESSEMFIELLSQWMGYEIDNYTSKDKLQKQNKNLEEFTQLVRHDLKNPLSIALGYLDILENRVDDPSIEKIHSSVTRINNLLEDFSLLSQTINELDEDNLEEVYLKGVIQDVWANYINCPDAELVLENIDDAKIEANEGLLRQIFYNLFSNSVEHNEKAVTITVKCTDTGIVVEDNGSGIESDVDVFEKGISTSETSGYGLYITKRIVESHGWTIDLEETDEGTRFNIEILESIDHTLNRIERNN